MNDVAIVLIFVAALAAAIVQLLRWCMRCEAVAFPYGRRAAAACPCGGCRVGRFCATCGRPAARAGAGAKLAPSADGPRI